MRGITAIFYDSVYSFLYLAEYKLYKTGNNTSGESVRRSYTKILIVIFQVEIRLFYIKKHFARLNNNISTAN